MTYDVIDDERPEPEDGIYFNLDEDLYHSLTRLSASGLKDLMISPSKFWQRSYLNPDKDDKTTPAMIVGKASHTAKLEPHKFAQSYYIELNKEDHPTALTTAAEIAEELDKLGEKKTIAGEKVLEKAKRLKEAGYTGKIWHLMLEDWEYERRGRETISAAAFEEIMKDSALLRSNPKIAEYITGGAAEVSILWTDPDTGLKFKARYDYLKPDSFSDLKNFSNKVNKNVIRCINDVFMYDRYHVQAGLYFSVLEMLRTGVIDLEIRDDCTKEEANIVGAIKTAEKPLDCCFIWMEKSGPPNVLLRKIKLLQPIAGIYEQASGAPEKADAIAWAKPTPTGLYTRAMGDIYAARQTFLDCLEVFGSEPFQNLDAIGETTDGDFPPFWLNEYGE